MNDSSPWNRHYQADKSKQHYPDENLVRLLATLQREGMDPLNADVLDYGFGSGRHLHLLKDFGFRHIAGCEISDVAYEQGRKEFADVDLRLLSSDDRLPFADDSFDVIVCWGVLHYLSVEGRKALLSEFGRLLTPEGALLGTLRSVRDTHFAHSDVADASLSLFSEDDLRQTVNPFFAHVRLGHMERTPLGRIEQRVAHWFFLAKRN